MFYVLDPRRWRELIATMLEARRALREDRARPLPVAKEAILESSFRYQNEWRFEKDRRLMQHALALFPGWDYAVGRLEWHSRPVFHPDPRKSRTQPRRPLHLPADPACVPSDETVEKLCVVTASSSNGPFLALVLQLIESIRATRRYAKVAIKVLDCGLTREDAGYLEQHAGVEVKDPGWDVDPSRIRRFGSRGNAWKALTSRPSIHRHFPGYEYYFWMDADTWIQDDRAVDRFVHSCEENGLGVAGESPCYSSWSRDAANRTCYYRSIPAGYSQTMENRRAFINNAYCIRRGLSEQLAKECEVLLAKQRYVWGVDLAMLNYVFHRDRPGGAILTHRFLNDDNTGVDGVNVCLDTERRLTFDGSFLGFVGLEWYLKHLPTSVLFASSTLEENVNALGMARVIDRMSPALAEEMRHRLCQRHGWRQGSVFYRIYPEPVAPGSGARPGG